MYVSTNKVPKALKIFNQSISSTGMSLPPISFDLAVILTLFHWSFDHFQNLISSPSYNDNYTMVIRATVGKKKSTELKERVRVWEKTRIFSETTISFFRAAVHSEKCSLKSLHTWCFYTEERLHFLSLSAQPFQSNSNLGRWVESRHWK